MRIRENARQLFFVLIGSLKLVCPEENTHKKAIELYETIKKIPKSICKFCVLLDDDTILNAIKLYSQPEAEYDEYGEVVCPRLDFVQVESFDEFDKIENDEDYQAFVQSKRVFNLLDTNPREVRIKKGTAWEAIYIK